MDLRNFTEIKGNAYVPALSVPLEKIMRDAVREVLHLGKFRVVCGSRKIRGTCLVDVDQVSGDELGARCNLRIVFVDKDENTRSTVWLRWELRGPGFLKASYLVRGLAPPIQAATSSDFSLALAYAIIDALDAYLPRRGLTAEIQQSYLAQGWSGPSQALDLAFEGSVFLTGGRHGSVFVDMLSNELKKTPGAPATTVDGVTWLVQLSSNRRTGGYVSGVLLCEPLAERRLKTFYTALSCVVFLKPVASVPNHRPALKLSFGLIGDLYAAADRFSLRSVLIDFVKLVEGAMINAGAVVCGDLKDTSKLVDDAWQTFELIIRKRRGIVPGSAGTTRATTGLMSSTANVYPGVKLPPLTSSQSSSFAPSAASTEHTLWLFEGNRDRRWPSSQDFCEAIQSPASCFDDPELQAAELDVNRLGLPRVASGAFACVFRLSGAGSDWAVRCFTTRIKDQLLRYERISRFIQTRPLPYTVEFEYLHGGLRLDDNWYPVLKMQWVDGIPLNEYISRHVANSDTIETLRQKFTEMLRCLYQSGIAHGDLQHGNIMVRDGELVLLDYDGMFVPELKGFSSSEKGHPNYQHPARGSEHFDGNLDNFSGWLIDSALLAISKDSKLWDKFGAGDESLLFRRSDLLSPWNSELINLLRTHECDLVSARGEELLTLLETALDDVPPVFGLPDDKQTAAHDASAGPLDEPDKPVAIEHTTGRRAGESENVNDNQADSGPWWLE